MNETALILIILIWLVFHYMMATMVNKHATRFARYISSPSRERRIVVSAAMEDASAATRSEAESEEGKDRALYQFIENGYRRKVLGASDAPLVTRDQREITQTIMLWLKTTDPPPDWLYSYALEVLALKPETIPIPLMRKH